MKKLLILDLDNTIFDTRTISRKEVESLFKNFEVVAIAEYGVEKTEEIIAEFWHDSFDVVAKKYQFPQQLITEFENALNKTHFELDIQPFADFELIKNIEHDKILVTTGFKKFQESKINSLGIESIFSRIYIDDILSPERTSKKHIFNQILKEQSYLPKQIIVIGDKSESELKAGFELGFTTIQVSKMGQSRSEYSDYAISDFAELAGILS